MATLQRYPVGKNFHQNCSISHSFRAIRIFVFCNFCEKFENSKLAPFLVRQIFFENWNGFSAQVATGSKI